MPVAGYDPVLPDVPMLSHPVIHDASCSGVAPGMFAIVQRNLQVAGSAMMLPPAAGYDPVLPVLIADADALLVLGNMLSQFALHDGCISAGLLLQSLKHQSFGVLVAAGEDVPLVVPVVPVVPDG